jgi:hypothetical protein
MIRPRLGVLLGVMLILAVAPRAAAQADAAPDLSIELASGTPLERQGRDQLERLVRSYDLRPWLFTRTIRIQSRVIPHSHPVLTLNTRYLDNDTAQVATFIHEQLHWLLGARSAATDSAMADLRRLYPVVPRASPEGERDEESTYLHLLVCMLEFDAVRQVFGEAAARRTPRLAALHLDLSRGTGQAGAPAAGPAHPRALRPAPAGGNDE